MVNRNGEPATTCVPRTSMRIGAVTRLRGGQGATPPASMGAIHGEGAARLHAGRPF
jgi:hypothetical protein